MSLWPPLPPDTGHSPRVVDILVALPHLEGAWGRAGWGQATTHVRLNGAAGTRIAGPDLPALAGGKTLTIELDAALDDWSVAGGLGLVNHWGAAAGLNSWNFILDPQGLLRMTISSDGTGSVPVYYGTVPSPVFADGSRHVVGGTWTADNGTNSTMQFRIDGAPKGTLLTGARVPGGLFNSSRQIWIGAIAPDAARPLANVYGLKIYADGTLVASPDFTTIQPGQTTVTDGQGNLWTVTGAATVRVAGRWGGYAFGSPTAMECDTQGLQVERGRSDPLDHIDPGGLRLTVSDPDRRWAPWVVPPNGFRAWRTGVPIQVRTSAGHLFTGVVTTITAAERPEPDGARTVEIGARDPLTFLAITDQAEQAAQGANELAGARLERIWTNAAPPAWTEHRFDIGQARMQATTLAKAALQEMWLTADSDAGMISCTPDGVVQYWSANVGLAAARRVVPQVTFTDDEDYVTTTPEVCTSRFEVVDDQAQVVNWVAIAATGGTQEVAEDQASISLYGRRTTHRNDLIHAEGQTWSKTVADTFLSRVNRQAVIVTPLVFDALGSPAAWSAAHTLDVGDRVAVHRSADGHRLDITASIDQISHDITPTGWVVKIQLSPGTQRTAYSRWGTARWGIDKWS